MSEAGAPCLVEIRTYRLKPGQASTFARLMAEQTLPMVRAAGMRIVAHGASNHEEPSYFLARAYTDEAELKRQQDAFYGSAQWQLSPVREALIACIDTYLNTLVWMPEEALGSVRAVGGSG